MVIHMNDGIVRLTPFCYSLWLLMFCSKSCTSIGTWHLGQKVGITVRTF